MATKLEYLKKSIVNLNAIADKTWYVNTIGIPMASTTDKWKTNHNLLSIIVKQDGMFFVDSVDESGPQLVPITDYKKNEPLFKFQDLIEVDGTWLPTIQGKMTTKLGNLIFNALVIYPSFKHKLGYLDKVITVSGLEGLIATRLKNEDEATPNDILVREMIDCVDRMYFLTNLADLINIATTPKIITPPPGIDKIKKQLMAEYEGQLDDPVKLVEMTNKLVAVDTEYLKDDEAADKIFNKKQKNARKKLYLIYGDALSFDVSTKTNAVMPSLSEGLSANEDDIPKYMDDLRAASYSRGADTQLAGYAYKILQRSLSSVTVSRTPCNTSIGLKRVVFKNTANKLISRYIKKGKAWTLINTIEEANAYIGTTVEIRSTMYCTTAGNAVCYQCLSDLYKDVPAGITNIAAEMSSVILNSFLKKMHGSETESTPILMSDFST